MQADVSEHQALMDATRELLCSLVPDAQGFSVYDAKRDCVWRSSAVEDQEIDGFVSRLSATEFAGKSQGADLEASCLGSGRTLIALPLVRSDVRRQGILIAVFASAEPDTVAPEPRAIRSLLRPVTRLIADSADLRRQNDLARHAQKALLAELRLVYEVDERVHGSSRSHTGLAHLVGKSGRFLEVAYSVLLIPEKRIRISATHSSWKAVNRRMLDRYLIDHLLPKLDGRQSPVIFEIPPMSGSKAAPEHGYQALVCPIVDRHGVTEGILALLARVNGKPFADSHRQLIAHVGRKVAHVIEQSYDATTGLMNRRGFEAQLGESRKTLASKEDKHQLLYLDVDNLALVNDKFGRKAGDDVVRRFAAMISTDLPSTAVQSRFSGDDFCILLTHADEDAARTLADTVRRRCETLRYLEGDSSLQISCSIGIAEYSLASNDESQALTDARLACESAKKHGKNRVEVYDANNKSMIRRHDDMNLIAKVQKCLDEDGFELVAQPILNLKQPGSRTRFEILLRMRDSGDQTVPTDAFLSAAERYQLMPQIDRWVVTNTLKVLSANRNLVAKTETRFCINLSGQSLSDETMLRFVLNEVEASKLPAACIGFELTESAAVTNLKKAQRFISQLHEIGCHVSLDDFGTGLSSFAYLKSFRINTLKIDGSFVRDIASNRISEAMVAAITQVAKVMGLETVAEYVENAEIQSIVRRLGVDFAQGHNIAKPSSLGSVIEGLSEQANAFEA